MTQTSWLENTQIATPCTADWNAMAPVGDAPSQVRHCEQCHLNVYNLSAMTRHQAEALIAEHTQQHPESRLCVRLYRRADGTVLTQDCPVGLATQHHRPLALCKTHRWRRTLRHSAATILIATAIGTFYPMASGHATEPPASSTPSSVAPPQVMGQLVAPTQHPEPPAVGHDKSLTPEMGDVFNPPPKSTHPASKTTATNGCKAPKLPKTPKHPPKMGNVATPPKHPQPLMGKIAPPTKPPVLRPVMGEMTAPAKN
jgi:hypothetical protein